PKRCRKRYTLVYRDKTAWRREPTPVTNAKVTGVADVQRKICSNEAARKRGDDWARRSRKDDVDGGVDEGDGGEAWRYVHGVRPDRQGAGGKGARHHDCDGARGVRERRTALRSCGLSGTRRLREEHDHGRGADGR